MKKSDLKNIIKEVLSKPSKKDCNCGCDSCSNVGNPGVVLNESLVKKDKLSENLRYHVDNKLPLTENTFRYGSPSFINLWAEARALYLREMIHVNELDKEILEETDLGNYGIYEGQKVPLDMPMLYESTWKYILLNKEDKVVSIEADNIEDANSKILKMYPNSDPMLTHKDGVEIKWDRGPYGRLRKSKIEEASKKKKKKKNPPLNKPKRGGSKAYYVYVRDPKTKKIKKVSFGSGGLKAKINNPKARQAFAKRHKCSEKTDKTKASYWSCRLPRYASLLGLKSTFTGFW